MLTDFIYGDDFFEKILIVESGEYISVLREMFPAAEIISSYVCVHTDQM